MNQMCSDHKYNTLCFYNPNQQNGCGSSSTTPPQKNLEGVNSPQTIPELVKETQPEKSRWICSAFIKILSGIPDHAWKTIGDTGQINPFIHEKSGDATLVEDKNWLKWIRVNRASAGFLAIFFRGDSGRIEHKPLAGTAIFPQPCRSVDLPDLALASSPKQNKKTPRTRYYLRGYQLRYPPVSLNKYVN
jgi:hypothetical protein